MSEKSNRRALIRSALDKVGGRGQKDVCVSLEQHTSALTRLNDFSATVCDQDEGSVSTQVSPKKRSELFRATLVQPQYKQNSPTPVLLHLCSVPVKS